MPECAKVLLECWWDIYGMVWTGGILLSQGNSDPSCNSYRRGIGINLDYMVGPCAIFGIVWNNLDSLIGVWEINMQPNQWKFGGIKMSALTGELQSARTSADSQETFGGVEVLYGELNS